jgi:hypothetical protein
MKPRFISTSRIPASVLLAVTAASFISLSSISPPVLAQINTQSTTTVTASQALTISQETLDGLLAPIALYPDTLLAQVLMASTYPIDVVEAARWQREQPDLGGHALEDVLSSFDWDPSVKSLMAVPQVLQHMSDSPRWTQALGRAVLDDQPRVIATIQALRQKARDAGTLTSNDKQTINVGTDAANGIEYISIAPASPQVVYVPVYDPTVVYGAWWWPSRPFYWGPPVGAVYSAGFYWGPHYYYHPPLAFWGGFNWGRSVITINRPVYRPPAHHRPHYRTESRGSGSSYGERRRADGDGSSARGGRSRSQDGSNSRSGSGSRSRR